MGDKEERRNYEKEFCKAFNEGKGLTWIRSEGHNLSKYDLCTIIGELCYAIFDADLLDIDKEDILNTFNENMDYEPEVDSK